MPDLTPEQRARQQIDAQLVACGWVVQDYKAVDFSAGPGSLPFLYESTGVETFFRGAPSPRSRRVFSFHRPETLAAWLTERCANNWRHKHDRHQLEYRAGGFRLRPL